MTTAIKVGRGPPHLRSTRGRVPLAWRELAAEPAKLAASVAAVAAAVALVLLLAGLRQGIGEQVAVYVDHQAPVLVARRGTRNFVGQTAVMPEGFGARIAKVPGSASVAAISQQFAMLHLHGQRVLVLLVGYDPGHAGGPWRLAAGRAPQVAGEIAFDRVLASEHGLRVGSTLLYGQAKLRVVGLSKGTTAWMTPLAFAARPFVNALNRQPGTASFFLVTPQPGVSAATLVDRIQGNVSDVVALRREQVAAADRQLLAGAFAGPLLAMVAIAIAVAVLVITLTVHSSIIERDREYASLKALGLSAGALLRLAGEQALALAIAGAFAGMLLSLAVKGSLSALAPKYLVAIDADMILAMGAGAVAMALSAALVPARYLARLDPATAFRR